MCAFDGCLYLYGGSGTEGDLSDFWKFDISSSTWSLLDVPDGIPGGSGLSMVLHNNSRLVLCGGCDTFRTFIYNIRCNEWREVSNNPIIPPLSYHALVSYSGYVLLIGGITQENELSQKVYTLSLANEWEYKPELYFGVYPFARYGHKAVVYKDCIWVIGGAGSSTPFIMNQINQWGFVEFEGKYPIMLSHFGAAVTENEIWVYGGLSEDGVSDGLYRITILREETGSSIILREILRTES